MKRLILAGLLGAAVAAIGVPAVRVSAQAMMDTLGTVHLSRKVMVDGKPLDVGTYQVRLTSDRPKTAAGTSPDGEQFVEFMKGGQVVAREVAVVVSKDDITAIGKGDKPPAPGSVKVELLKGDVYLRVWLNKGGTHYLLHLPLA